MSPKASQEAAPAFPDKCRVIALRELVVFPFATIPLIVGRPQSEQALLAALDDDKRVAVFTQKDERTDAPSLEDLHPVGVLADVMRTIRLPDGNYKVLLHGLTRLAVDAVLDTNPYLLVRPTPFKFDEALPADLTLPTLSEIKEAVAALGRFQPDLPRALEHLRPTQSAEQSSEETSILSDIVMHTPEGALPLLLPHSSGFERNLFFSWSSPDAVYVDQTWEHSKIADVLIARVHTALKNKVYCLLEANAATRLRFVYDTLVTERRHAQWTLDLKNKVTMAIKDQHRELFLREQLRAILDELGESVHIVLHNPVFRGRGFKHDPALAFALMPFADRFKPVFDDLVKPVVERFDLRCIRADDIYGPRPIMEDIWRLVNEAKIIIADVTGKNPNVFYEIGLAHAVGKEVVIISQSLDDVPFDLRHLRCIVYQDSVAGFKQFEKRLDDTLAAVPGLTRARPVS